MQINTIMRYYYTPIRLSKTKNTDHTKCWQGYRVELSYACGRKIEWCNHFGREFGSFFKKFNIYLP